MLSLWCQFTLLQLHLALLVSGYGFEPMPAVEGVLRNPGKNTLFGITSPHLFLGATQFAQGRTIASFLIAILGTFTHPAWASGERWAERVVARGSY